MKRTLTEYYYTHHKFNLEKLGEIHKTATGGNPLPPPHRKTFSIPGANTDPPTRRQRETGKTDKFEQHIPQQTLLHY